jgi:hypothetical protein
MARDFVVSLPRPFSLYFYFLAIFSSRFFLFLTWVYTVQFFLVFSSVSPQHFSKILFNGYIKKEWSGDGELGSMP